MLVPARLAFNADGIPVCEEFGDIYHSADGGPGQASHVFLGGNGLPGRWAGRDCFVIVETGFGTGLNFLATWAAWKDDPRRPQRLHFLSVEKHPFRDADLGRLHERWPEFQPLSRELRRAWPPLVPGFHRLHFEHGAVTLTLAFGEVEAALRQFQAHADAFFLDGFAPAKNPEMWSPRVCAALRRLAAPGATLATWSVATLVRDALAAAGFNSEKRPGYGHKREMLSGSFDPRHAHAQGSAVDAPSRNKHAVVIGAGIAGTSICERLAARGWRIDLIERHPQPALEASGNHAGVMRPMLARDDCLASRFSRTCFLYALRHLGALEDEGLPLRRGACGVLQVAKNPEHERMQAAIVATHRYPGEFVSFLERDSARDLVGWPVEHGGWFFPQGGWVNPPSLCRALLQRHPSRIRTLFEREALVLEHADDGWRVRTSGNNCIAAAPVVILANAADVRAFSQTRGLPLKAVRGQVTHLPGDTLAELRHVVCREGYVSPLVDGMACLGATFDFDDDDPIPRASGHANNLERLERLLPGTAAAFDPGKLDGRVGFRTASLDRLPLVGALPDETVQPARREARLQDLPTYPGLHGLLGFGARGIVWAVLAAEMLAAQLNGEPGPVEADLAHAVDPARFRLRSLRGRRSARNAGYVQSDAPTGPAEKL